MHFEASRGDYRISTASDAFDVVRIHAFLYNSYWSPGIPIETVRKAIENSLGFALYYKEQQIGFARVVSDYTTFGYLCDVYVEDEFRGHGLGKWLIQCVKQYPQLQGLRRFMLGTLDAHGLYQQFEFTPLANPARMMEIFRVDMYRTPVPESAS